jgi:hypothetical protein
LGVIFNWIGKPTHISLNENHKDWDVGIVKPLSCPATFQNELDSFFQQFESENDQLGGS